MYENLKTISSGKTIYIHKSDAVLFVNKCRELNLSILGLDGVYYNHGEVISDLDLIADFSDARNDADFVAKSCLLALNVIAHFPDRDDLYVDFVISA